MSARLKCPHCQAPYAFPPEYDGKAVRCKSCDKPFRVRLPAADPPPPVPVPVAPIQAATEAPPPAPHPDHIGPTPDAAFRCDAIVPDKDFVLDDLPVVEPGRLIGADQPDPNDLLPPSEAIRLADSVAPVRDAGLIDLVETDQRI